MKQTFFLLFLINFFYVEAQESVFYTKETNKNFTLNKFGLEVYNLNFIKNNEYFNFITDGLTLLGTQLHPEFIYNNSEKTQFKAGVFLQKNFGETKIDFIIPTFSFNYLQGNHQFTIGNWSAKNNHGMIEPMMASEKILTNALIETGARYQYTTSKFSIDAWMDWEKYIRPFDNFREVFTVGISSKVNLFKNFSMPIQYTVRHKGGQVNLKFRDEQTQTDISDIHNVALGLEYKTSNKTSKGLIFSYYFLAHNANGVKEYPFANGNAHYFRVKYLIRDFNFMLAYYHANQFISSRGNEMFQTYSLRSNINYWNGVLDNRYVGLTEPNRKLLFSKVYYEKKLAKNVKVGVQGEAFFQLNNSFESVGVEGNKKHQFDYSYGVYVLLNDIFNF
ncbi:conserved exported protein of unknown function [Tenacibaculum sp. 190524A02b]|uniref:hypothetical protein n=1 Tax=Tenacibaculum vairaonense TaxID=3137860 RepID=UPI0032B24023